MQPAPVATGALWWGRAALLSAVALTAGAAAHVQADGLLPGPGVLVALVALGTLASAPLLRRPGSTRRIVVLLVAGQSVVHMALAVTAGHRGDPVTRAVERTPVPVGSGSRTGSFFDVAYASRVGDQAGGGLSVPAPVLHAFTDVTAHPTMALAHLVAAAVCGWWLAMGERALWRLLDLAARGWADIVAPALERCLAAARAVTATALGVEPLVLVVAVAAPLPQYQVRSRSVSRRGPPPAE